MRGAAILGVVAALINAGGQIGSVLISSANNRYDSAPGAAAGDGCKTPPLPQGCAVADRDIGIPPSTGHAHPAR